MHNRKLCLISKEVGDLLVKQIAHELKNYTLYLTFANFFETLGFLSLSEYFKKRAEEEDVHHKWCVSYLNDADFKFVYPGVEENKLELSTFDYIKPFTETVNREIETTQMIYNIYETCISQKDYMTASWLLEKLIKEQIEEENTSRMALTIISEEESDIYLRSAKILELL